jgi:hypothetical protein
MSKVIVNTTDTFEQWRLKNNTIFSLTGRPTALIRNSVFVGTAVLTGHCQRASYAGTPATFKVTNGQSAFTANLASNGTGYVVANPSATPPVLADIIIIPGSEVGGVDGVHDVSITVLTVSATGAIVTISQTGTVPSDMIDEINQLRSDISGGGGTGYTPVIALTTTAQTLATGINELDALQGDINIKGLKPVGLPKSTFASITDAIEQIDVFQGNDTLDTTSSTVSSAINEHETDIGTMSFATSTSSIPLVVTAGNHVVLGSTITSGLNATKARTDFLLDQLGGKMSTDYDGAENDVISALDKLYDETRISFLDNTYVKRDGSLDMTGMLQLDNLGVSVSGGTNPMLFKVGATGSSHEKMRIKVNGNVGIGKTTGINYLLDVAGDIAGTKLRYGTDDTDVRYLRTARTTEQTVSTPTKFSGTLEVTNVSKLRDTIHDLVGEMVSSNSEQGIEVEYIAAASAGKLKFQTSSPTITLTGDVSGTGTLTNLNSVSIDCTIASVPVIIDNTITGTEISTIYNSSTKKLNLAITADPKIILGGDLSGNVTLTNCATGNYLLNATINANSITLGTDTVGNYVKNGTVSGNGLSGSIDSEGGQFSVTSNATSASTANTIVFRDGSKNFSCNIMSGTATSAQWADLAEKYKADAEYPVGTVISLGGSEEVTLSIDENDTKVIGVISEYPAYLMNSNLESEFTAIIALKGRVPVIVEGSVEKGDIIVSGGNGVGIVNNNPRAGSIIGKSLENSDSLDNRLIEVVIL